MDLVHYVPLACEDECVRPAIRTVFMIACSFFLLFDICKYYFNARSTCVLKTEELWSILRRSSDAKFANKPRELIPRAKIDYFGLKCNIEIDDKQ